MLEYHVSNWVMKLKTIKILFMLKSLTLLFKHRWVIPLFVIFLVEVHCFEGTWVRACVQGTWFQKYGASVFESMEYIVLRVPGYRVWGM